jgi:hypothetical protein
MGSNVHFQYSEKGERKPIPEELGCGEKCLTIPRYSDGFEFMKVIWDEGECIDRCICLDKKDHAYMCDGDSIFRPKDFAVVREKTKELQPIWQKVLDYMESEPKAYVQYD